MHGVFCPGYRVSVGYLGYRFAPKNHLSIRRDMARKVALVTGITGQDGSYLAEFLLEKGYEVHGIKRRASSFNQERIEHMFADAKSGKTPFFTHYGDVTDLSSLVTILIKVKPTEFYNLAAQSHVHTSFELPVYTAQVTSIPESTVAYTDHMPYAPPNPPRHIAAPQASPPQKEDGWAFAPQPRSAAPLLSFSTQCACGERTGEVWIVGVIKFERCPLRVRCSGGFSILSSLYTGTPHPPPMS